MQSIGGVSRSYAELTSQLRQIGCNCSISIRESDNIYLKEKLLVPRLKPLYYTHNLFFEGGKLFRGQRMLTRQILSLFGYTNDCWNINKDYTIKRLKKQRYDIFEPTFFSSYFLPYIKNKPFVLTVHDMIPELFPEYFSRDDSQIIQKKVLCPLASHIHVPSNKTKEDLVNILNIDPDNITVIPHGGPHLSSDYNIQKKIFDFPYLLYVGDRFGYKNFIPWLKTIKSIVNDYLDVHVVCTGKPFNRIETQLIEELRLKDNVIHYFADQTSFGSLYHNAIAFVYPSEYEGFGLPILEAFAYGCPVMLNEASCFPEVGGKAAVYFNLKAGPMDFYEKFKYVYTLSSSDRLKLIKEGQNRLSLFSWDKAAHQLMNIYEELT